MKQLSPYGNYLAKQIQQDNDPNIVIIFIGKDGAERATQFQPYMPYSLYLPYPDSPLDYSWPLHNCYVYLVDTGHANDSFIQYCALCFFSYGAQVIHYQSALRTFTLEKGINHEQG
jgi:hypothetical protein